MKKLFVVAFYRLFFFFSSRCDAPEKFPLNMKIKALLRHWIQMRFVSLLGLGKKEENVWKTFKWKTHSREGVVRECIGACCVGVWVKLEYSSAIELPEKFSKCIGKMRKVHRFFLFTPYCVSLAKSWNIAQGRSCNPQYLWKARHEKKFSSFMKFVQIWGALVNCSSGFTLYDNFAFSVYTLKMLFHCDEELFISAKFFYDNKLLCHGNRLMAFD